MKEIYLQQNTIIISAFSYANDTVREITREQNSKPVHSSHVPCKWPGLRH